MGTLPGAWRYRVSVGRGLLSVNIQWLGEIESLIWNSYLSVAACTIRQKVWSAAFTLVWQHVQVCEQIRPWDTLPCCWDVNQATKNKTKSKQTPPHPPQKKKKNPCGLAAQMPATSGRRSGVRSPPKPFQWLFHSIPVAILWDIWCTGVCSWTG